MSQRQSPKVHEGDRSCDSDRLVENFTAKAFVGNFSHECSVTHEWNRSPK